MSTSRSSTSLLIRLIWRSPTIASSRPAIVRVGTSVFMRYGIKSGLSKSDPGPDVSVLTGLPIPVRAVVNLAGLSPKDVRVEAVVGRIGVNGNLEETQVMTLPASEQVGNEYVFLKEFVPHQTGRLGYSLRISPNHYDDPLTRPCNSLLKWSSD